MDHPINVTFIRLIVLLPLLGAAINFLAGALLQKTFGKRAISLVGCGVVILAFILALRGFFAMLGLPPENRFMLDDLWRWFDIGGLNLDIAFWLDPLSMVMTLIITGVGGLIHIYSTGYMHDDDGYWRFFAWLNLFTFAMLVLVLGDNLWLMFVVAQKPEQPGAAPKRLTDDYPELTDLPTDRSGKRLWRELLPVYVHANIADAEALEMHRRTLVNNALCLLRELWQEQPKLFPKVDRSRLCFYLVGGSDYSGCGKQIRFPSRDPLVDRLRNRVAAEPDREFAAAIFLPPENETQTTRPPQLALFYSTCHLPDLVADYYEYVDRLTAQR